MGSLRHQKRLVKLAFEVWLLKLASFISFFYNFFGVIFNICGHYTCRYRKKWDVFSTYRKIVPEKKGYSSSSPSNVRNLNEMMHLFRQNYTIYIRKYIEYYIISSYFTIVSVATDCDCVSSLFDCVLNVFKQKIIIENYVSFFHFDRYTMLNKTYVYYQTASFLSCFNIGTHTANSFVFFLVNIIFD